MFNLMDFFLINQFEEMIYHIGNSAATLAASALSYKSCRSMESRAGEVQGLHYCTIIAYLQ